MIYDDFVKSMDIVVKKAGYVKVDTPAFLPALWARDTMAGLYFYMAYDGTSGKTLEELKADGEYLISQLLKQMPPATRHWAVIHIGFKVEGAWVDSGQKQEVPIDAGGHDVFYNVGYDLSVSHHLQTTVKLDRSLEKIKEALNPNPIEGERELKTRGKTPFLSYAFMVLCLLGFVLLELRGGSQNTAALLEMGAAQYFLTFEQGQLYRLITPMFLHIGFVHLAFNMMWVFIAGTRLERHIGLVKYLLVYMLSGIGGNVAFMLLSPYGVAAGASGAVFGILGGLLAYSLVHKRVVKGMPVANLLVIIGLNLIPDLTGLWGGNIAHSAHIGGLLVGFVVTWILEARLRSRKEY